MYCTNCGKKINENEEICPFCKVKIISEEKYSKELQEEKHEQIILKDEDKKLFKKSITFSLICLLISSITAIYSMLNLNNDNSIITIICLISMLFAAIGCFPFVLVFRSDDKEKYYSYLFFSKLIIGGLLFVLITINFFLLLCRLFMSINK